MARATCLSQSQSCTGPSCWNIFVTAPPRIREEGYYLQLGKLQFATWNGVPQELYEVIVEDVDIVVADESSDPVDIKDEDEAPYHFFAQDTGNEILEVDRLHRAFTWPVAEPQTINEFKTLNSHDALFKDISS